MLFFSLLQIFAARRLAPTSLLLSPPSFAHSQILRIYAQHTLTFFSLPCPFFLHRKPVQCSLLKILIHYRTNFKTPRWPLLPRKSVTCAKTGCSASFVAGPSTSLIAYRLAFTPCLSPSTHTLSLLLRTFPLLVTRTFPSL